MPRPSITRRLIRRLSFPDVKAINQYFELPPRKSKDSMVSQILYQVGTGLDELVSAHGPFSLSRWNEIVVELGGAARQSFVSVCNEIAVSLDPVYDEFDGETSVMQLRGSKADTRLLASKLGISTSMLREMLSNTHGGNHLSTFVTAFRQRAAQQAAAMPHRNASICVASTKVLAASVDPMSQPWMVNQLRHADAIDIAAGFYDAEFLEDVLKNCSAHSVRLVFNGLGGQRLHAQRAELTELVQKLTTTKRKLEVKLSFAPGMFHTKLFLMTDSGKVRAMLGSANATCAAFSRNEEVLVSLPDAGALKGYFESVWSSASHLDSLARPADSLVSFFRSGVLYFKPTAHLTTTINPFRDLLKLMTNEERSLLGGVELPFSDQVAGIGPFDLKRAIQGVTAVDDWEETETDDEPETPRSSLSIKRWAVETCFGYWVPSRLDGQWQTRLQQAGSAKRKKIEMFRAELNDIDKEVLLGKYQSYLAEVKKVMAAKIERLPELLEMVERDPFNISYFEKFCARVAAHLDDPGRIRRLAEPFISGAMPELWDDEEAYSDFRSSFFEFLDQVSRLPYSKAKVARIILRKLGVNELVGGEADWSSLFAEFFENNVWTEDDWIGAVEPGSSVGGGPLISDDAPW